MWILKSMLALGVIFSFSAKADYVPVYVENISAHVSSDDSVVIVVKGYLADACTELGATEISLNADTGEIQVQQHAIEIAGEACGDATVPFEKPVMLGLLRSGEYRIENDRGTVLETFSVRNYAASNY